MSVLVNINRALLQVWSVQWLVVGALLLPALAFFVYRRLSPHPIRGIPHNTNLGLLGDLPELWKWQSETQQVFNFYTSHFEKLDSPIVQLFVRPFRRPCVFVSDPDVTEDTLTRRGDEFDRSALFGDLLNGIVPYNHARLPTNKQMRAQRRLLSDTMTPHFLRSIMAPCTRQAVLELADLWKRKSDLAGGDYAFEAYKDMQHAGLDALWAATFMTKLGASRSQKAFLSQRDVMVQRPSPGRAVFPQALLPSVSVVLNRLLATSEEIIASPLPKQHHWVLRQFPRMRAMYRTLGVALKDGMDAAITQASSRDADAKSVAELVYRRSDAKAMPREVIRDELLGFIAAGHDPPAMALAWGVVLLADHGEVQTKLRDNLHEAFGNNELPSADAISAAQIPYLDACIEEILRAGTSQAGVSRVTTRDTELMGYWIPKGTDVFFMFNGPGYKAPPIRTDLKSKYHNIDASDLDKFRPERWLKETADGTLEFDPAAAPTLQFGAGFRGCFGRKFAYLELRIFVVLLVLSFEFLAPAPELRTHEAFDKLGHCPKNCYVRLRSLRGNA